jgi:hypothetical protein
MLFLFFFSLNWATLARLVGEEAEVEVEDVVEAVDELYQEKDIIWTLSLSLVLLFSKLANILQIQMWLYLMAQSQMSYQSRVLLFFL